MGGSRKAVQFDGLARRLFLRGPKEGLDRLIRALPTAVIDAPVLLDRAVEKFARKVCPH